MCGIFGYVGRKTNAAEIVFAGIKFLEYRGYDSWGVAVVPTRNVIPAKAGISSKIPDQARLADAWAKRVGNDKSIVIKKHIGKIGNATIKDLPDGNLAFAHTRWATHGGVTVENAHPHLDCTGRLAIIHNGIVENYAELKKTLPKKHVFRSQTDTEVVVHLIEEELHRDPNLVRAVRIVFNRLSGLNAIIVLDSLGKTLLACRIGSPLAVGFGKNENFLASDAAAIIPHTRKINFLEDGEMAVLTQTKLSLFDLKSSRPIHVTPKTIPWKVEPATRGKFPNFMLKEIYEQPQVLANIATDLTHAKKVASFIHKAYGTYLVGCGSAGYAALSGNYLFAKIASKHLNWAYGSEFGYHLEFLTPKSLVIAISQSGETMDILETVTKAKDKHATLVGLVNVLGSTLYRLSNEVISIGAGQEVAVASTKALTAMLAHLVLLAYSVAGKPQQGQTVLQAAVRSSKELLKRQNTIKLQKLAEHFKSVKDFYIIGRGLSYPASLEAALKIKEIAYIHAEGMASGELKHGTLALVEKGTPVLVFLPNDETYGANLAGAMEMKARGAIIIGVSHQDHEVFDHYVQVLDAQEATIIPNIIAAQLLAYYLTIARGLDPDKPRNLAKSVTVK